MRAQLGTDLSNIPCRWRCTRLLIEGRELRETLLQHVGIQQHLLRSNFGDWLALHYVRNVRGSHKIDKVVAESSRILLLVEMLQDLSRSFLYVTQKFSHITTPEYSGNCGFVRIPGLPPTINDAWWHNLSVNPKLISCQTGLHRLVCSRAAIASHA